MSSSSYDVAVIGGGPAGCSAAIQLAREGARVALLEAQTYPHDKLCGEFLSPECVRLLADLELPDLMETAGAVSIRQVRFEAPGGVAWQTSLPAPAWGLSRSRLDTLLAERAVQVGVDLYQRAPASALDGDLQAGFKIEIRPPGGGPASQRSSTGCILARFVIAAYGKRSALDRSLGRPFFTHPQPYVAFKAHFHGPPLPGRIRMHVFPGGYCGLSQVEDDETNLCFLAHTSTLQAARRQFAGPPLQSLLDWMQAHNPALRVWLSQAELAASGWRSIAQVSFERKQASYAGALMAGDSAGLIAPLAGDGIAMALQSGQVAASQVSAVLSGDRSVAHLPGAYQSAWDRQFRSRMRLASFLQAVLLQPTWASLVLQLLNRVPSLGDLLVEKTRGSLPV